MVNPNQEENDPRTGDIISSLFDMLFGTQSSFTFFISIDSPQQVRSNIPVFMSRSLLRAVNSNNTGDQPHFLDYIQEIFNTIKKKELVKKELIKNKPYVYKKVNEKPKECLVCLNEFKPREKIRKLGCEHEFHKRCIDKWLTEGNPCCPLCRKEPFKEK